MMGRCESKLSFLRRRPNAESTFNAATPPHTEMPGGLCSPSVMRAEPPLHELMSSGLSNRRRNALLSWRIASRSLRLPALPSEMTLSAKVDATSTAMWNAALGSESAARTPQCGHAPVRGGATTAPQVPPQCHSSFRQHSATGTNLEYEYIYRIDPGIHPPTPTAMPYSQNEKHGPHKTTSVYITHEHTTYSTQGRCYSCKVGVTAPPCAKFVVVGFLSPRCPCYMARI